MNLRATLTGLTLLMPTCGTALTLDFPAVATAIAEITLPDDSRFIPTGPFDGAQVPGIVAEGTVVQQSWKIATGSLTTLQILVPLRAQLEQAGYSITYECKTYACGGFDFRYRLNILPEPDMHVNLGDFRYLAARKSNGKEIDHINLIVSRSLNVGFVQVTQVGSPERLDTTIRATPVQEDDNAPTATDPIGRQLEALGFAALSDLTFKTGSSTLGDETFASLRDLAGYLKDRPDARVVLVGHTDAEGALSGNISLSRKRAASVAARLVDTYGVPRNQVSADGVGFLAPRASNLTDAGRTQNRRVEVILTSTK